MTSLQDLKIQRGHARGSITRIRNFIENITDDTPQHELECRLGLVDAYFEKSLKIQDEIDKKCPSSDEEINQRIQIESLYIKVKSKILALMKESKIAELNQSRRATLGNDDPNVTFGATSDSAVKLPRVKLPIFNGNYSDYPNFIQQFSAIVHNENIPTIRKFQLLVDECLKGEAKAAVKSLDVIETNYSKALELLKLRYDNKCLILRTHVREIFNVSSVGKNSSSKLRELIDNLDGHLRALRSLATDKQIIDAILLYLVSTKLDTESFSKWEDSLNFQQLPTWQECSEFMNKRCQHIESKTIHNSPVQSSTSKNIYPNKNTTPQRTLSITKNQCPHCKNNHSIHQCKKYSSLSVMDRFNAAKLLGLCINCLSKGHGVKNCLSLTSCQVCKNRHHTLLHRYSNAPYTSSIDNSSLQVNFSSATNDNSQSVNTPKPNAPHSSVNMISLLNTSQEHVFLATAIIHIKDRYGNFVPARALLDSGSQVDIITENLAQKLYLKRHRLDLEISTIGDRTSKVKYRTTVTINSRINNFETCLDMWILPCITAPQPEVPVDIRSWSIPDHIKLADPEFNEPQRIDTLIGANIFFELLQAGQIKLGEGLPILQNSKFGWIVTGSYRNVYDDRRICNLLSAFDSAVAENLFVNDYMPKFWNIEEVGSLSSPNLTPEQIECEQIFCRTVAQREDGRLVVKLPFLQNVNMLGDSFNAAERRFYSLERRLEKNHEIASQYITFMREYEQLGHMVKINDNEVSKIKYIMPHQCVLKPDSSSTKLRVVFDASAKTSTNISLNDTLMVGPTVQQELFSIVVKFRSFKYAITADISKMYRQIFVDEADSWYQCIIWRESPEHQLNYYRLTTVTYGTASAPFHATRSLQYLADKHQTKYPIGATIIKDHMYMDDLISGGDSIDDIQQKRVEAVSILNSAGLKLLKWYSNHEQFLEDIADQDREKTLRINDSDVIKALGLVWEPTEDMFRFITPAQLTNDSTVITKRSVLADICRLFDPLGLINPVIVLGKMFMQQLWKLKIGWDDLIPDETVLADWIKYKQQLKNIEQIRVPRYVLSKTSVIRKELHGFSDASNDAYGCCIYIRCQDEFNNVAVNLVSAKSKVTPIKSQSIARYELCGAHLLTKLYNRIRQSLDIKFDDVVLWTDSEVVLDWLGDHASNWVTFVANRVSFIQEQSIDAEWRYVDSKSNPADIVSRGAMIEDLINSCWFRGPEFLYQPSNYWPCTKKPKKDVTLERRKVKRVLITKVKLDIFENNIYLNDFDKLRKMVGYLGRFLENCRRKKKQLKMIVGALSAIELDEAFLRIIWYLQQRNFADEIAVLMQKNEQVDQVIKQDFELNRKSSIKKLNPFIKNHSGLHLLHVGGRLRNSELPYETKYPILIPKNEQIVLAYIRYLHRKNFHAGAQALVSISRQRFWIVDSRNLARKVVHECLRCFKMQPLLRNQIMGDLPAQRVCPSRPFLNSGVDFCGPFYITARIRGKQPTKSYIAVFICFTTKAVHMELVSNLSSEAFLAALKRFISRRGMCKNLYCDNATNFIGARNELAELRNKFYSSSTQEHIRKLCAEDNIEFHHIPPRSPHFGGLWEAAVKAGKSLLFRSLSTYTLTFEELATVVTQIEAILNSRPITPLSADPSDDEALSPGHFLVGGPLVSFVEPDITTEKISRLKLWQQLTSVRQHFWNRWSKEYITQLQNRYKWNAESPDLTTGTMVLIADDNLPAMKWFLGRIVKTTAGPDGRIRVCDVRTKNGIISRSIHRLAPLPFEGNGEQ